MGKVRLMTQRRLLVVHAHPDDECLSTGGVLATHTAAGDQVTLVTCTLGEEGEILLPHISHLAADQEDHLASHRVEELAASMAALGISDNRILGGPGTYRDSGMMGEPSNDRDGSFWRADLREASDHLVAVIRETRPQVLITYDDFGGYGHPDHIQAHRVATYAAVLAAVPTYRPDLGPAWDIPRWYWTAFPKSEVRKGIQLLQAAGDTSDFAAMDPDDLPFTVDDDVVAVVVDIAAQLPAKRAAMAAHASQINLEEGFFALSNNEGMPVFDKEYFRLAKGDLPPGDPHGDLFVGLSE